MTHDIFFKTPKAMMKKQKLNISLGVFLVAITLLKTLTTVVFPFDLIW